MMDDQLTTLLRQVAAREVSIKDARKALEGVELDEETYARAVDHGVFNAAEPGTVVSARLAPSGASALVVMLFVWGIFWTVYWVGSMVYGLLNGWDQQQLSYHLFITFLTLIIMGVVYMKWVLPDLIVVKYERAKFIPEHQQRHEVKDWHEYRI